MEWYQNLRYNTLCCLRSGYHNHIRVFNKLMKGKALRKHSLHEKTAVVIIGVGSGAARAAVGAPIFWLVGVFGPRFFNTRVACFITKTQTLSENGICTFETIRHICFIWTCNFQQETWLTWHTSLSFRACFARE